MCDDTLKITAVRSRKSALVTFVKRNSRIMDVDYLRDREEENKENNEDINYYVII